MGRQAKNLVGYRKGRLTVKKLVCWEPRKWLCVCDCGNEKVVLQTAILQTPGTSSCGCLRKKHD